MKVCSRCKQEKAVDAFSKNQWWCKACRAEYYRNEKPRALARSAVNKRKARAWIASLKMERGCSRCGYNKFHKALEFHHFQGEKERTIANAATNWSKERIQEEIEKCEVVCANCHREIHG